MERSDAFTVPYLDSESAVDEFIASLGPVAEIALDTEGASFHRFVDRIYLIQITTRSASAIIDPLPISTPVSLGKVLQDPTVEVVIHDADYDLRLLHQDYGWSVTNVFDTRVAAQLLGIRAFSLAALLERYFGLTLDKRHQRADWSLRPLSAGMLDYAAQDTLHLLQLRDVLRTELERMGRLEWAREEFERLQGARWEPDDSSMAFLRIKGARELDRRQLAILRELVAWRDAAALKLDRATFRVVNNDVLLALVRMAPTQQKELTAIKGMPRGIAERSAQEILGAIQAGLAVPEAELPRFPKAPRWNRDPDFDSIVSRLKVARDQAAERLDMDPGVLFPRERLEAFARRRPTAPEEMLEVPGIRRWQVAALGDALLGALNS